MTAPLRVGHWPLRFKIVLLLFVSAVLPLILLGGIEFLYARDEVQTNVAALLTARGDEVAGKLDAFHDLYRRSAEHIAELPEIALYAAAPSAARAKSAPGVRSILEQWQKSDGNIRGIAILDPSGNIVFTTEAPLAGRNLASFKYVQAALGGAPTISDLHLSGQEVGSVPTIAYLAPIKGPSQQLVGVSVIWVRANAFWTLVAVGNEKAGAESFSVLYDHHGVRIAHSYKQEIVFHPGGLIDPSSIDTMVAERRFGERTRELLEDARDFPAQFDLARSPSPGRALFRGFAPVNQQWSVGVARRLTSVPWTLFYMIPEKSLDALVQSLVTRIALLTLGVLLLAIIAGFIVSRGIVGSVKLVSEVSEALGACASELGASVTQLAASTSETAAAVSQTTSTVEEVKQTALLATDKARNVSESAQKTAQISLAGCKATDESIEGMRHIQAQMDSIGVSIERLLEQSHMIGDLIATVNDLAEQSNLLAVNASIEAAKAGEYGKGFVVVAQEVKSLAQQSKQATAQVRSILGDIQKATGATVRAAEQGAKAVDAGMTHAKVVDESIRLLSDNIAEAAQAAMQIAVSAQQQQVGMDQVAAAMQNINAATAQNAESTLQNENAARQLHELRLQLKQLVESYQI